MIRINAALAALAVITLSGCAVGYNSTLFYTQSNIGLDAETKPPTAEISIARREGVIEPGFEGGQTPTVVAGFQSNEGPFSRFFFGVKSTFAGGDAAEGLSQGPGGKQVADHSGLCLSEKPKEPFWSWLSIPEKGEVTPFAFSTDTIFGLKVSWTGTSAQFPDSLHLGFNRKELAWAPLFGTDATNCRIPGTDNQKGSYVVWMPSFLAALNVSGTQGSPSDIGVAWVQYFATGTSATTLANRDEVREIMLKQVIPANFVRSYRSTNLGKKIESYYYQADGVTVNPAHQAEVTDCMTKYTDIKDVPYLIHGGTDSEQSVVATCLHMSP